MNRAFPSIDPHGNSIAGVPGMAKGIFRSGTSGLVLSEPNKLHFPAEFQEKHRLIYYASKFNSIEINSSFYKIPLCRTYKNWGRDGTGRFSIHN